LGEYRCRADYIDSAYWPSCATAKAQFFRRRDFTEAPAWDIILAEMRTLEELESDVRMLPPEKQEELRDWLENLLEDQLELTGEFKAKIERGEQDLREGRSRIRKP
jgi:hypothetical protein